MATYKHKNKKQSNDKFVSYVIIGFAIAFFVLLISMVLFKAFDNTPKYSDFETIDDFAYIQMQEEDNYLVYFYQEECYYCQEIKTEVLNFASNNDADIKVYLMDASVVTGQNYISQLTGTPSLLVIDNGSIVDLATGPVNILAIFDAINNNTYALTN